MELRYQLPDSLGVLVLEAPVVAYLQQHRQRRLFSREAGGQLFATLTDGEFRIVEATGPRRTDHRTAYSYHPDRSEEQREISDRYVLGRHFVGDWHTHRQRYPSPSDTDLTSVREMVRRSRHGLPGFFLVVVGTELSPRGLHVSFVTADHVVQLRANEELSG